MRPLVSVVLVSYQTRPLLLEALARIRATPCAEPYEVIVVDNASSDGSADAVAVAFPEVRLIRSPANVGFGRAVNIAATQARGEWLLLLNPDTEPIGDMIGEFVRYARREPAAGLYVGRTLSPDGSDDGRSVFGWPSLWGYACFALGLSTFFPRSRLFNPEQLPARDRTMPGPVPAASGCLLLVRRSLFAELGGFSPNYFMYGEDLDLCVRATRRGAVPVLVPGARVVHHNGAASSGVGKRVMLLRGKITFLRLHWPRWRARTGIALLAAGIAVRALGSRLTGRGGWWREVWRRRTTWLSGWPTPIPTAAAAPATATTETPATAEAKATEALRAVARELPPPVESGPPRAG